MVEGKVAVLKSNWGFIEQADESKIYFSHFGLKGLGFKDLKEGDVVTFDIEFKEDGKTYAANIQKITGIQKGGVVLSASKPSVTRSPAVQVIKLLMGCLGKELIDVKTGLEFEQLTFLLLRLLGIHSLYQYEPKQQAGRADGFFICDRLAVMYDCTLQRDFEEKKKDQIENYVNKMRQSSITIEVKTGEKTSLPQKHDIQSKTRQVWIITKGVTRDLYETESVVVREIAIDDLASLLEIKLNANNFKESDLLKNLLELSDLSAN